MDKYFHFYKSVHDAVNEAVVNYFCNSQNTVAHYASPQGFLNILQSKELWFGNISNVNDLTEVQYAFEEIIYPCVRNYSFSIKNLNERILHRLGDYKNYKFSFVYEDKIKYSNASIFVFSTSLNCDSTMLWNMYCKNNENQGYAIIFDKDNFLNKICEGFCAIDKPTSKHYLMAGQVIYDKEDQRKIVNDYLDHLEYNIKRFDYESERVINKLLDIFIQKFFIMALFMKDSDFDKEQEYRFLAICDDEFIDADKRNPPYLTFVAQKGNIVSRLVMPFTSDLIKQVSISPFNSDINAEETTQYFLNKCGVKNISIIHNKPKIRL